MNTLAAVVLLAASAAAAAASVCSGVDNAVGPAGLFRSVPVELPLSFGTKYGRFGPESIISPAYFYPSHLVPSESSATEDVVRRTLFEDDMPFAVFQGVREPLGPTGKYSAKPFTSSAPRVAGRGSPYGEQNTLVPAVPKYNPADREGVVYRERYTASPTLSKHIPTPSFAPGINPENPTVYSSYPAAAKYAPAPAPAPVPAPAYAATKYAAAPAFVTGAQYPSSPNSVGNVFYNPIRLAAAAPPPASPKPSFGDHDTSNAAGVKNLRSGPQRGAGHYLVFDEAVGPTPMTDHSIPHVAFKTTVGPTGMARRPAFLVWHGGNRHILTAFPPPAA